MFPQAEKKFLENYSLFGYSPTKIFTNRVLGLKINTKLYIAENCANK